MNIKNILAVAMAALSLGSCSDFLDQKPDTIYTDDQVFGDAKMIKSVLANLYGRITYGQNLDDSYSYTYIDEAMKSDGGPDHLSTFGDDHWRVYDYGMIRNCNQFLEELRSTSALSAEDKKPLEGEVRFIRAWVYFNMVRGLGGVPIVGDSVMSYSGPDDVPHMRKARATEAKTYDYVISECKAAATLLSSATNTNSARANKWAARMLEARAAVYAGSLATFNNKMTSPIKTSEGEVGIPTEMAEGYYRTALEAAKDVIENSPYKLQDTEEDKGLNFYNATSVKENNTEVIWARDHIYPGNTVGFTGTNIPKSLAEDIDNSYAGPTLNMVEMFEPLNTKNPGQRAEFKTKNADGSYVFYNSSSEPFIDRDPRLWGSVIYPGASFKGVPVVLQAGQLNLVDGKWQIHAGNATGTFDDKGNVLTSVNGPFNSNQQYINKSGFYFRKFLDETPGASKRGQRSAMWQPYFRMSEAYLIACEASFQLGDTPSALSYINKVRERAGVQDLKTLTFDNIVHENAVEFAFEGHRWWDLKRWRLADKIFNGNNTDKQARHRSLWPYLVVAPGNEHNGQWIFVEDFSFMSPNARYFQMKNYYNFYDQGWIDANPLLVKNPYQ